MKKHLLLMLSLLLASISANSQNSWLLSGNASQQANFLGTVNCSDLSVRTNNYERLKILCNGVLRAGGNTTQTDTNSNASMVFGSDIANARLDVNGFVNRNSPAIKANVRYIGNSNVYAIHANSYPATGYGYGVYSSAGRRAVYGYNNGGSYSQTTYGTYSYSTGSAGTRVGSYGYAAVSGSAIPYGMKVYGYSSGTGAQYGMYTDVSSSGTGVKYSIYSNAPTTGSGTRYAGYFQGQVYVTFLTQGSDRKLKENIVSSKGMMDKLMKLNPSEYLFKKDYINSMSLPQGKQFGLIADELEMVFPELVTENVQAARYDSETEEKVSDEITFKSVNYIGLIPVVIQGVKEQQTEIDQIRAENAALKTEMAGLLSRLENVESKMAQQTGNSSRMELKNPEAAGRLDQNTPNPFNQTTEIKYSLPEGYKNAMLNVYGNSTTPLFTFSLSGSQNGMVVLQAGSLVSGEYTYELVIDGRRADVKKMLITR